MRYLDEWIRVLDSGLDDAVDVLTSSSKSASELRQNSPFAGLLDEMRVQVLHAFNEHWRCAHEDTHVRSAG